MSYENFIDKKRDNLLTTFAKEVLKERYLLKNETPQEMFGRVAESFSSNPAHAERIYNYISNHYFMASTPILSNAGTKRGLPISCYLNKVEDSLESISEKWTENVWIAARGGGIGTCWSDVRSIGEDIEKKGQSSGVIPFMKVMDSLTLAINQGSLRRGSAAVYLDISHPEIEEFLEIRKPSGDFNRKSLNLHHGVTITDDFMEAVVRGDRWGLVCRNSNKILKYVDARDLFQLLLETRISTGEPYIIYTSTVNNNRPSHHKKLGLEVHQSNLCAEIVLPTGLDHKRKNRTAVCCLGSLNLEKYDEWKDNPLFIEDCLRFLDNVLETFLENAREDPALKCSVYSVERERSVGLGVMGFHSYLQKNGIPFEGLQAKLFNKSVFKKIRKEAEKVNIKLAEELGSCPDAEEVGEKRRFSYMLAVAPTASISVIAGGASPCVEPFSANVYTHKTLSGNFSVRNKYLTELLQKLGKDDEEVWSSIVEKGGSVQHLDFLTEEYKKVFKTAFEIDQRWVVDFAADRSPFIDQSQSINLFLDSNCDKWDLLMLHISAWKKGVKSLYYLRSKSIQRAQFAGAVESDNTTKRPYIVAHGVDRLDYDECLSCQ